MTPRALAPALLLALLAASGCQAPRPRATRDASAPGTRTVLEYMNAFRALDHSAVLACLTDDVEWIVPGAFHVQGKAAFDAQIENDAFTGAPWITVERLFEQDGVVVAEGHVHAQRAEGGALELAFCDVFELEGAKVRRLTSYLVALAE